MGLSTDDMNILSYDSELKQIRFVYTEKYTVNQQKSLTSNCIKRIISIYESTSYRITKEVRVCYYTV